MAKTLLFVLLMALLASCSDRLQNQKILEAKDIKCPDNWQARYEPWGESGLQLICHQANGPVFIAEYGRLKIEGQYTNGKAVGEWRWFDESGKIIKTERYD